MTIRIISKGMNIILWASQIALAVGMVFGGAMKLFQPIDSLAASWPWAGEVAPALVRITGVIDLVAAVGLILSGVMRSSMILAAITSIGIVLLMISASVFHISRGEGSEIGVNVAFGLIALFIVWGRLRYR